MRIDGPILKQVVKNSNLNPEQEKSTVANAAKIYKKVPTSQNNYNSNVGLAVGKIQSGKTANIINLSALSFDNDHKMVIMLLSDMTNLLDQNYTRIKESFAGINDVLVLKKSKDGDFDTKDKDEFKYLYKHGKKIIVCSLKHYKHINQITEKIKDTGYDNDYSMIIDDEGDDISQNTSKGKHNFDANGKPFEETRSSNNKAIVGLKTALKKCGYLSVTATPEVQIFLQTFQSLAPNYCVTFEPGKGYTGLITFHSKESKYVEEVDDYSTTNKSYGIPSSLERAIMYFICGCIIRNRRETKDFKHAMMIHNSKLLEEQGNLTKKINTYISNLKLNINKNNQSGKDFEKRIIPIYEKITSKECDIKHSEIIEVLNSLKIHSVNGNSISNDLKKLMEVMPYHIIIGGDMLDRGITIDGLAVTYIIRQSNIGQMDTVLQRARWFGYKSEYLDVCKVFMPKELSRQYYEMIESEDAVWNFLEQCSELKTDMRNEECELVIDTEILRPASASKVLIESDLGSMSLSQNIVQRYFVRNNKLNNQNKELINSFDWSIAVDYTKYMTENSKHKYLEISMDKCEELINNFKFPDKDGDQKVEYNKDQIIKRIKKYYQMTTDNDNNGSIILMNMRPDSKEERSIKEANKISGLLQGRNEKNKSDPDFYPGDGYLADDKIIVQIHHVILKDDYKDQYKKGDEVIMLCINMPKMYTIKNIVHRKSISDLQRDYN